MEKVQKVTSKVIPLPMKDVDTDLIIPAQYLTSISREGFGQHLFKRLREADANFPFNKPEYAGAQILVTDSNFGCGSSREHAVWALYDAGIRVIVAKSFADIFYNNSAKNGLLLVTLPESTVDEVLRHAQTENYTLAVDLEKQEVRFPDNTTVEFNYDPFRKHCLLNGHDDIDYILSHRQTIEKFRERQQTAVASHK